DRGGEAAGVGCAGAAGIPVRAAGRASEAGVAGERGGRAEDRDVRGEGARASRREEDDGASGGGALRARRRATGATRHDRAVGKSGPRGDGGLWARVRGDAGAVSGDLPPDHSPTNAGAPSALAYLYVKR